MFDRLSHFWERIQGTLFPELEEELPPLTKKQQQLIATLEVIRIEKFLFSFKGCIGRPQKDRAALARAFVAKAVYNMPTTRTLIDRLQSDISLRRISGWERKSQIPDESTFSRAFAEFAESGLLQTAHNILISTTYENHIVGHISRDSTPITGREKPLRKEPLAKLLGRVFLGFFVPR